MRCVAAVCLAILIVPSLTEARDIYVDNVGGDDLFNGSTAEPVGVDGPVRTIARALRLAEPHDRVVLANTGTPYRESVSLSGRHSGSPAVPFVLDGNGAVLDGSAPIDPRLWSPVRGQKGVFRFRPPRMAYQQIFLEGKPLARVPLEPMLTRLPALEPLEWYLWNGYVYLRIEDGKWIDEYALSHTQLTTGVTPYHVRHAVVVDLVVQGFQLDGVNVQDALGCTLHAITARGNARSGIAVTGSSRVSIEGCLAGDNGLAQLLTEGLCVAEVSDTQLLPGTAPDVLRRGGDVRIVEDEPQMPPQME
jgi:hypothetical protein